MVLICLHREMHRALSLLLRRTQQLERNQRIGNNRLSYRKEARDGWGEYANERESCVYNE
jgi:hypothetical protein